MIYMFLAKGFEETEALAPLDLLRRADLSVTTVGVGGKNIVGAHGISVSADITDAELDLSSSKLDAVILPGGMPGTLNLDACPAVHMALDAAAKRDAIIAAICAAPMILGKKGLLHGKEAICYPGFEGELIGAEITDERCVTDKNTITAKGAGAAAEFGISIVRYFCGDEKADSLAAAFIAK